MLCKGPNVKTNRALSLQMLRCQNCAVTYAKAHVNHGAGMDLATGEFTAPVSGSYYFQVRIIKLLEMGMDYRKCMYTRSVHYNPCILVPWTG